MNLVLYDTMKINVKSNNVKSKENLHREGWYKILLPLYKKEETEAGLKDKSLVVDK